MATGSNDVDEIYHRMAVIRREHHTNVRESVAGAEAMADWGRYTWTYPWIALGAAAAVGYLIYTSGRQKVTADTARLADGAEAGEPVAGVRARGQERSWGKPESAARRLGHLVSPWPCVRARITCCIGSNNNSGRGLSTGPLCRRRPGSGEPRWAGWSGRGSIRSSGFNRNQVFWRLEP